MRQCHAGGKPWEWQWLAKTLNPGKPSAGSSKSASCKSMKRCSQGNDCCFVWVSMPLSARMRLADMQKREPTCRVGGPRCKKALGDARVRRTRRIGRPTCKKREPTCRGGGPRCKKALGDARVRRTRRIGRPTCKKREPTCRGGGSRCKTSCLEPNGKEIVQ